MCHLPSLFPIISTKLNHLPVQIMWTEMPWDFILDKKVYKRLELENRFAYEQGCKIFCKDDPSHLGSADQRTAEVSTGDQLLPMVKFQKHCNAIRQMLIDFALPMMREFFRMRAAQMKLPQLHYTINMLQWLKKVGDMQLALFTFTIFQHAACG